MRPTVFASLIALATASVSAPAEVRILGLRATDASGTTIAPKVGEPFYVTASFSVAKQAKAYRISIETPSGTLDPGPLRYGIGTSGDYWIRQGPVVPLFDGPMDVAVLCSAAKVPLRIQIVPTSPAHALETFAPRALSGRYGARVVFDRLASVRTWLPLPESGEHQVVTSVSAPGTRAVAQGFGQTLALGSAAATGLAPEAACTVVASGVRSNLGLLRGVPMSALDGDATWLVPEARIQSTHPEIVKLARSATRGLPVDPPLADVALALYSTLLKRSTYARTEAAPDALNALRKGKGECGDLSALFVALCRASGVPARPVAGFSTGENNWHVWAEFLVPGRGWVPVDPAYALGRRARSPYPLYFGVIPELRDRVALATGFTATVAGDGTTFLQTPQIFPGIPVRVRSASFWCVLG